MISLLHKFLDNQITKFCHLGSCSVVLILDPSWYKKVWVWFQADQRSAAVTYCPIFSPDFL